MEKCLPFNSPRNMFLVQNYLTYSIVNCQITVPNCALVCLRPKEEHFFLFIRDKKQVFSPPCKASQRTSTITC
jgi:hypothetical protein